MAAPSAPSHAHRYGGIPSTGGSGSAPPTGGRRAAVAVSHFFMGWRDVREEVGFFLFGPASSEGRGGDLYPGRGGEGGEVGTGGGVDAVASG